MTVGTDTAMTPRHRPGFRASVATFGIVALVVVGLLIVIGLWASPVLARSGGIVNRSGNPETGGATCSQCHGLNASDTTVVLNVLDTAEAGATVPMSITVSGGEADGAGVIAGFNASISGGLGELAPQMADTRVEQGEITHATPKAMVDGEATFQFQWTAPSVGTVLRMYAAGVSANGNGGSSSDFVALSRKVITITGGDPEVEASLVCSEVDGVPAGELSVALRNPFDGPSGYTINVAGDETELTLFGDEQFTETISGLADGQAAISILRDDALAPLEVFSDSYDVACGDEPPPAPISVPGADGPIEVAHVVSCLAGNGRVDTNIVNTGDDSATYRIEFQGLSPRAFSVNPGDWWRMPITGRPDGDFEVVVKREDVVVSNSSVTVSCDGPEAVIGADEIQVVNGCRGARGYVLFQFLNSSDAAKPYVIEFEGVANRSTTASAYGQSVRAVTGRPDGEYQVLVRTGQVPVATFSVTVDCATPAG